MNKEKQGRGALTERVASKARELLGRDIDRTELRLMPYIQYTMVNNQKIEPEKIDQKEREILSKWRAEGHIEGGASGLAITKDFWNIVCELTFMAYVDIDWANNGVPQDSEKKHVG